MTDLSDVGFEFLIDCNRHQSRVCLAQGECGGPVPTGQAGGLTFELDASAAVGGPTLLRFDGTHAALTCPIAIDVPT